MHHHPGSHDPILVGLSILIAALASYTALDLATRMRAASGSASLARRRRGRDGRGHLVDAFRRDAGVQPPRHCAGLAEGRYVALSVTDNGCGMDAETLAHAHEPFFTTKGVGKGTGLGLSMVKGLAEQSGGTFVLRSRPGEGTTAEIWLPVAQDAAAPLPRAERPTVLPRPSSQLAVLVVDDDLLVLDNTAAMLDDLGHTVLEARSGEEALRLLRRSGNVDIVVTDYAMPGMTGLELAEAIAAERPGTPVVLTTGYAELPRLTLSHLPRISKPFDQAALATAIESAIGQPAYAGAAAYRTRSA